MIFDYTEISNVLNGAIFDNKKTLTQFLNTELNLELSYEQWKGYWRRDNTLNELLSFYIKSNTPTLIVYKTQDTQPNFDNAYVHALNVYNDHRLINNKKTNQSLNFPANQPICIVNLADVHFGHYSVNVHRVFSDLDVINKIPNCHVNLLSDLTDNFIGSWTTSINHNNPITINQQYALRLEYLKRLKPQLKAVVSGNHDNWSTDLIGYDVLANELNSIKANTLYDTQQLDYTLCMPNQSYRIRLRHMWKGRSELNPTYGIEKMAMAEKTFDIGVGGHFHIGSYYREFNNYGNKGAAILCGTYKEHDEYAAKLGLYKVNDGTAVCLIIHPDFGILGINNIHAAYEYMTSIL
jgi:hypothetical protein